MWEKIIWGLIWGNIYPAAINPVAQDGLPTDA